MMYSKAICFFLIFLVIYTSSEKYTTKFDNIDVDKILTSDRLLRNYVNCLLDKGKCTPDGLEMKVHLTDSLQNNCSDCSQAQINAGHKATNFIITKKPDLWIELKAKYDPNGAYEAKYKEELDKIKSEDN